MNECVYNYDLSENLKASEQLLLHKFKRKTGIVSVFVVILSVVGVVSSIGMIFSKSNNWWLGIVSVLLIVGYFFIDKIFVKLQLKKQKEFFYNSNLKSVTKVKVAIDENKTVVESFFNKGTSVGSNVYQYKDLTAFKVLDGDIFLIYNDEKIVMIKKDCMTEKSKQEFFKLKEKFIYKSKKTKINKKN